MIILIVFFVLNIPCVSSTYNPLFQTNEERLKVEDKLAEVELQHNGLQDLIATLKDGKGAQKVAEWHSKMEQLRLEQLKHKRMLERQREQVLQIWPINLETQFNHE